MSAGSGASVDQKRKGRSAVTNGNTLFLKPTSLAQGRRLRDVLAGLAAELGGMGDLAESEIQIVRRAASTAVECEVLEALRAAGEAVSSDQFATILNASRRAMKDFEAVRRKHQADKPKAPRLREYLASKGAVEVQPV
jgi:DNA-binding transcriptional regulator YiaG